MVCVENVIELRWQKVARPFRKQNLLIMVGFEWDWRGTVKFRQALKRPYELHDYCYYYNSSEVFDLDVRNFSLNLLILIDTISMQKNFYSTEFLKKLLPCTIPEPNQHLLIIQTSQNSQKENCYLPSSTNRSPYPSNRLPYPLQRELYRFESHCTSLPTPLKNYPLLENRK